MEKFADTHPRTYEVAVIGLGAMGSAALYQLSRQGADVIGIDQYAPPHVHGSSHGESRITRQTTGEGAVYMPLVRRASEIWHELEQKSSERLFEPSGLLMITQPSYAFYDTTVATAKRAGIQHELLSRDEVEARFPAIKMYDNEVAYFEPGAGFLYPERCIETQLRLAQKLNATIRIGSRVIDIAERGTVRITLQSGEVIEARQAIVAAGPWVRDFVPPAYKELFHLQLQRLYWFDIDHGQYDKLKLGAMPVFLCGSPSQITPGERTGLYGFPALAGPDGGMKFAQHSKNTPIDRPETSDAADHSPDHARWLHREVSTHIRYVKPNVLRFMNCLYTLTPDEGFIIDRRPNSDRIILASPCSGHGFKHSAAIGEILAELATRNQTTLDISAFSLARFAVENSNT